MLIKMQVRVWEWLGASLTCTIAAQRFCSDAARLVAVLCAWRWLRLTFRARAPRFPWGVPPVQRILVRLGWYPPRTLSALTGSPQDDVLRIEGGGSKKLSAEEDAASDFLRELLQPFMAMQQQGGQ